MHRLLTVLAVVPLISMGIADGEKGIWFEFGELLHALQEWARWLLGG